MMRRLKLILVGLGRRLTGDLQRGIAHDEGRPFLESENLLPWRESASAKHTILLDPIFATQLAFESDLRN
jgi:hypothetical protein